MQQGLPIILGVGSQVERQKYEKAKSFCVALETVNLSKKNQKTGRGMGQTTMGKVLEVRTKTEAQHCGQN